MPRPDFDQTCNSFCLSNICKFLLWMLVAGGGVAWVLFNQQQATAADLTATRARLDSATQALEAHMATETSNNKVVIDMLQKLTVDVAIIQGKLQAKEPGP